MKWSLPLVGAMVLAGCASAGPSPRRLHYHEGALVHSRPVAPGAYGAYLEARLALHAEPPELDRAADAIAMALRYHPRSPHLWTVRAEIEHRRGHHQAALRALDRALGLRPGYPPAEQMLAVVNDTRTAARGKP